MHEILFSFALNFSKGNISYMKLADIKATKNQITKKDENNLKITNTSPIISSNTNIENVLITDSNFLNENENTFSAPYIESSEFGQLLPEDEKGNVILSNEESGPKFLDTIKNKLIQIIEKDETKEVEKKIEKEVKKIETIITSEEVGPTFFESIKNKFTKKEQPIEIKEDIKKTSVSSKKQDTKKDVVLSSEVQGVSLPSIFTNVKNKILPEKNKVLTDTKTKKKGTNIFEKIKTKITGKEETKELEDIKIVGSLFDSELNNSLKDIKEAQYKEIISKEVSSLDEILIEYTETQEYQKFLAEKELTSLIKPEKISVPKIKPKSKEILSYKNYNVPQELLSSRSEQNKHIPRIMQNSDRENTIKQVIDYGMLTEFKAFMNSLRDANLVMSNQYSLLTYATYKKQYSIMKYLLHIGADINKRDDKLDNPLIIAIRNNDMQAVKILLEGNTNPNVLDILKRTPLIYCIENNQQNMALLLIEKGADVNITNGVGEGTLSMSTRLGRNLIRDKILSVLLKEKK